VDYALRRKLLDSLSSATPKELLKDWESGRIKLFVIQKLLQLRRDHPHLLSEGNYEPLETSGAHADRLIAFIREHGGDSIVTIVPRLTGALGFPPIAATWRDTRVHLPTGRWQDVFTGHTLESDGGTRLAEALADFPVAVLVRKSAAQ